MSVSSRFVARIASAALALSALGCAKTAPAPGGLGDPCLANGDCASGFLCSSSQCVLPANLGGCEAGALRCNGDDVEKCASDGQEWDLVSTCTTSCVSGACAPEVCTPGDLRCDGDASEECTPSGNAWAFVQECPSHCDSTDGKCKAPICTPFAVTCSADKLSLLTCDSFGAVQSSTACPTGEVCESGACLAQVCTPGAKRCDADAAEQCSPDGSAWLLINICPSHCDATSGACEAPICTPFAVSCSSDNSTVLTCDSFGASLVPTVCAQGQICDSGRCQTTVCTPGAARCASGSGATEICNALGDGWIAGSACPFGCATGANGAGSCLAAACAIGALRCAPDSPSALEECLPAQTGFAFETFCVTGCTQTSAIAASCNPLVCPPLARRCDPTATNMVDTCNQIGTEWDATDTCPQGCAAGQCVTDSADCNPGDMRCNGIDTQACQTVASDPGVTQWTTTGTCLAGCSSGACLPGGSCVALTLVAAAPLSDAGVPTAPGDGQSSVLIYSAPIVGEDSAQVPDGQLFTVSATLLTSADAGPIALALPTADADPATPGTQVASSGGRIRFTVPAAQIADGGSATVQVAAQLEQGGSCAAQSTFALTGDPTVVGETVLLAEDFSTTTYRDPVNTTADWNVTEQQLDGAWPDGVGNGGDGDLTVNAANSPFVLGSSGFAPAFSVLGLSSQGAVVDGVAQGLSGGDEVILWDAQGSSQGANNAGTWELLTVQSTSGSSVSFTAPIQNSYGAAADQDVSTQKVSLQRIPHFATLTIAAGGELTTNAWDGNKGGLIFLRASHISIGQTSPAAVDVSSLGFRGGVAPAGGEDATGVSGFDAPGGGGGLSGSGGSGASYASLGDPGANGLAPGAVYGSKLLGKLFLGAGGGGTIFGSSGGIGGGAVVIFADSIDFSSGGVTVGLVRANGQGVTSAGSGAGGTIWIGAPNITVGTGGATVALAQGGTTGSKGGLGRIRIDEQTTDVSGFGSGCSRTTPACTFGVAGPLQGESLPMFSLPTSSSSTIIGASLLTALDASSNIAFAAAATSSSSDFGPVSSGTPVVFSGVAPHFGQLFRWRAEISPDPTAGTSLVRGLQWQLQISNPNR